MKEIKFFNTAHPMAESGKPIFIPFGEWKYDGTRRQRLDRKHGEKIANELRPPAFELSSNRKAQEYGIIRINSTHNIRAFGIGKESATSDDC